MAPDERADEKELERQRLLEEIRKRAEEAELKRIEEEEKKQFDSTPSPPPPRPAPSTYGTQKIFELRAGISVALNNRNVEKATALMSELATLSPEDPMLGELRSRLRDVQQRQAEAEEKRLVESKPKEDAGQKAAKRESLKKKIAQLLEKANSLYQQEKYEKALASVDELLGLDRENDEAMELRKSIEKAQGLAARIRQEEAKRKAEEAAVSGPEEEPKPAPKDSGDVWGSKEVTKRDTEFDLPPETEGPPLPPRPRVLDRVVAKASRIRIPVKGIITVAVVVAGAIAGYLIVESIRTAVFPPKYSLLIFPAESVIPDASLDYFTEGLTEELINRLVLLADLRVVGPVSSLYYSNPSAQTSQSARSLGASSFFRWSVRKMPESVQITVALHDTTSHSPFWVSQFQSSMRELPTLLNEISRSIAENMGIEMSRDEVASLALKSSVAPSAYEAVLRARYILRRAVRHSPEELVQVATLAIQADSSYSDAYLALCNAHLHAFENGNVASRINLDRASRAVLKALSLGSRDPEAYRLWGLVEQYQHNYAKAVDLLEQAVSLAPSDAESQRRLSTVYLIRRRSGDALKAAERAASDDPRNIDSYTNLGLVNQMRGDYQTAAKTYEEGAKLAPDRSAYSSTHYADVLVYLQQHERASQILNDRIARARHSYVDHYRLARIYQLAGKSMQQWQDVCRKAKALIAERLSERPNDGIALSYLALVHTLMGEFRDATLSINGALESSPDNVEVLYNAARMHVRRGEKEQALEYLKKAVDRQYRLASILDLDFYILREDPEYLSTITR